MSRNEWAKCPFDPNHKVCAARLQYHIVRCAKNHRKLAEQLKVCPYNATHIIYYAQYKQHISECPERNILFKENIRGKTAEELARGAYVTPIFRPEREIELNSDEESWEPVTSDEQNSDLNDSNLNPNPNSLDLEIERLPTQFGSRITINEDGATSGNYETEQDRPRDGRGISRDTVMGSNPDIKTWPNPPKEAPVQPQGFERGVLFRSDAMKMHPNLNPVKYPDPKQDNTSRVAGRGRGRTPGIDTGKLNTGHAGFGRAVFRQYK